MIKTLIFTLTIFSFMQLKSQVDNQYYINNNNDTIKSQILSYSSKRVVILENGEKKKFKPNEIKAFVFGNGKQTKFVSLNNDKNNFYEEVISGKLSLYNVYTNNAYNGMTMILPVMMKNDKIVYLNVLNPRKRIAELISDCPMLLKEWNETENYPTKDKDKITEAYNKCKQ